ncbi:hypothetical protein [Vibrio sp. MA40-2]
MRPTSVRFSRTTRSVSLRRCGIVSAPVAKSPKPAKTLVEKNVTTKQSK